MVRHTDVPAITASAEAPQAIIHITMRRPQMTLPDITLAIFTLSNTLRVLTYLPQIAKAAADRNGVVAVSFATWGLFLLANMSSVAYAVVNKQDWMMATVFLGNTLGCAMILLIGGWKRSQYRNRFLNQSA